MGAYDAGYFSRFYLGEFEEPRRREAGRLLRFLQGRGRRLLDVGAGVGHLAAAALEVGWEVVAVEPSEAARALARKLYDLSPVETLDELVVPNGGFDVIAMVDVLSHLAEPASTLSRCFDLLRPGGTILIKTPNRPSRLVRVAEIVHMILRKDPWMGRSVRFHAFDSFSLPRVLAAAGFFSYWQTTAVEDLPRNPMEHLATMVSRFLGVSDSLIVFARKTA